MECERCSKKINTLKMSFFNTQMCCKDCLEKEMKHPLYEYAKAEELKHVLHGVMNFKGIGLPEDLK